MKKILLPFLCLFIFDNLAFSQTSTTTGGLWSATSTWVGGVVPNGTANVIIANGATVNMDQNVTMNATFTLTVTGTLNLNPGFTLTTNAAVTISATTGFLNVQQTGLSAKAANTADANHAVWNHTTGAIAVTNTTAGALTINGYLKNSSSTASTGTNGANTVINDFGVYEHATNSGTLITATWSTDANLYVTGIVGTTTLTVAALNRSFGNIIWECSGQTAGVNFVGNLRDGVWGTAVKGNFDLINTNSGSVRFNNTTTNTTTINGNFNIQSAGIFVLNSGASPTPGYNLIVKGNLNVAGSYTGTSSSGTFYTLTVWGNFNVTAGTTTLSPNSSTVTVNVKGNIDVSGGGLTGVGNGGSTVVINVDNDFVVETNGNFDINANTGTQNITINIGRDLLISNSSNNTKGFVPSDAGGFSLNITRDFSITDHAIFRVSSRNTTNKTYTIKLGGNFLLDATSTFILNNTSGTVATTFTFSGAATGYTGGRTNATSSISGTFTPNAGTNGFSFDVTNAQLTNKKVTLLTNFPLPLKTFTVGNGAILDASTFSITGAGGFILSTGAKLITANADGIRGSGGTPTVGSIRTTGSNTFNSGATVEFNASASAQNCGFANIVLSTANTIANIIINNTHTAPNVTLDATTTVTGTLTFSAGKLLLGANNVIVNNPTTGISVVNSFGSVNTSYAVINGVGAFTINSIASASGNVLFPIGPSTNYYNPLQISNTGTTNNFTVRVIASPLPGVGVFSLNDYWVITPSGAGANATLSFQWNATTPQTLDELNQFDRNLCAVMVTDGTNIVNTPSYGAASNSNTNVFTRSLSGITSFTSYWSVASQPAPLIAINDVITGGQVSAQSIGINSSNNIIYSLRLDASGLSSTLTNLSFPTSGVGTYALNDFSNFKLYYTTTSTFSNTNLLATISAPVYAATQTFPGFSQLITSGTSGYFWITADVPASGATSGNNITVTPAITNISGNLTFNVTPTYLAGTQTAAGTQTIAVISSTVTLAGNLPAAGNISPSAINQNIYGVSVTATGSNSTLTGVTFTTAGTYNATDITNFQLWVSTSSTFSTGTATSIGTIASGGSGSSLAFTSIAAQNLFTNTPVYLYVTGDVADISTAIPLHTINLASLSTSGFTISTGTKAGSAGTGNDKTIIPYAVGDYGTILAGPVRWTDFATTWRRWDGSGWNTVPASAPSSSDNVWINAGHIMLIEASAKTCNNLYVYGVLSSCASTVGTNNLVTGPFYVRISGATLQVSTGGWIGGGYTTANSTATSNATTSATGDNAAGFSIENLSSALTIKGNGGSIYISRFNNNLSGANVTVDHDMTINYHGTTNQGGHTIGYFPSVSNTTLTVNAGKTLTFAPWSCLATTTSSNGMPNLNTNIIVNGTIDVQATPVNATALSTIGRMIYLGTNTGSTSTLTIGSTGIVNVPQLYPNGTANGNGIFVASSLGTGTISAISVATGGQLNVSDVADFGVAAQTVTGGGSFTLGSGASMRIGSTAGITTSAAAGAIQTTTRTFNSGGGFVYLNSLAAQVTGDGLPATVSDLMINNALGVTLTNSVRSTTTLSMTSGALQINGNTLRINNGSWTSGTLTGSSTSNLIIDAAGGSMKFTGGKTILKDLLLNATATATLADSLDITAGSVPGSVTSLTNATLTTGDKLTLKSDANGTSRIGVGPADGSGHITGNVVVERFFQGERAWRCVSAPITTTATIQSQWQEGGEVTTIGEYSNPSPGFGTHITGPSGSYVSGLGFDRNNQNNPSLRYWDQPTQSWLTVPNTNATSISDYQAYMLFVRGSRANDLAAATYAATDPTIIRSTGTVKVGDQSAVTATGAGNPGFILHNPYASAIYFKNITKSGLNGIDAYRVWDPLVGGTNQVGNWILLYPNPAYGIPGQPYYTYSIPPISPIDLDSGRIESGAAVLLTVGGGGSSSVTVKEENKAAGSSLVFRPRAARPAAVPGNYLRTYLIAKNVDNTKSINDGVYVGYDASFNNDLDDLDIVKFPGFSENLSIKRNNKLLTVERRSILAPQNDTIFLNIANMKAKNYQFKLILNGFGTNYTAAYVEDTLFHTKTQISLQDTTDYDFTIAAGLAPAGRFRIVFAGSVVLPVSIRSIKAAQLNNDIAVEWKVENELNIKAYEVETSIDGVNFIKATVVAANNTNSYKWLDQDPANGNNYYRIRSINQNGDVVYSSIVKVTIGKQAPLINVSSNIITNGSVVLQLNNMPKGKYNIRLMNTIGQVIATQGINHIGGSSSETIYTNGLITKGIYQLQVIHPDNIKTNIKLIKK